MDYNPISSLVLSFPALVLLPTKLAFQTYFRDILTYTLQMAGLSDNTLNNVLNCLVFHVAYMYIL